MCLQSSLAVESCTSLVTLSCLPLFKWILFVINSRSVLFLKRYLETSFSSAEALCYGKIKLLLAVNNKRLKASTNSPHWITSVYPILAFFLRAQETIRTRFSFLEPLINVCHRLGIISSGIKHKFMMQSPQTIHKRWHMVMRAFKEFCTLWSNKLKRDSKMNSYSLSKDLPYSERKRLTWDKLRLLTTVHAESAYDVDGTPDFEAAPVSMVEPKVESTPDVEGMPVVEGRPCVGRHTSRSLVLAFCIPPRCCILRRSDQTLEYCSQQERWSGGWLVWLKPKAWLR